MEVPSAVRKPSRGDLRTRVLPSFSDVASLETCRPRKRRRSLILVMDSDAGAPIGHSEDNSSGLKVEFSVHTNQPRDDRDSGGRRSNASVETQCRPQPATFFFCRTVQSAKAASRFRKNYQITRGSRAQATISSNNLWGVGYMDCRR